MTTVEMAPETELADSMPPGGVVILPLPSHPVTPLNVYPENKKVETEGEKPASHSAVLTGETDHVETTSIPTNNSLK